MRTLAQNESMSITKEGFGGRWTAELGSTQVNAPFKAIMMNSQSKNSGKQTKIGRLPQLLRSFAMTINNPKWIQSKITLLHPTFLKSKITNQKLRSLPLRG